MTRRYSTLIAILLFTTATLYGQTEVPGNNPSSIRWKYYDTKALKLIFPEGNEAEAARVANIIDYIYDSAAVTIGPKRKHLDLLIQTNQVVANGYVGLAPYRSEFYATQVQNFNILGSAPWFDLLSFHEYRHALQFANSRHGLTKFLSILGGQSLWQLGLIFALPPWYMEGDAVQTESLFSGAGRGRTPFFFQEQRALLLNNKDYSYIKARNGSLKDLLPDHYRMGYAMLHYVRNENGPDTWAKVVKDGTAFKGVFYSFSQAMKRHTGHGSIGTYHLAYDQLKKDWESDLQKVQLIPTTPVTQQPKKTVTSYQWAHYLADGSIICRKESFKRTAEIVHIKDNEEKSLVVMGFAVNESFLSVNNNRIAWTEMNTDARWQNRNYSDIHTYDLNTGKERRLTYKTKFFSPQFSAKGDRVAAVEANESLLNRVVFLNAESGMVTDTIPNLLNDFISYPSWTKNDEAIVFLAKRGPKIAMLKYDLSSKTVTELTPWSQQVIGPITVGQEYVYFTASYTGINNIFAVSLNGDKNIRQLTSVKISAGMPAVSSDEKTLMMSEFNYKGDQLTQQAINPETASSYRIVEPADQEIFRIKTTPIETMLYSKIPGKTFEAKPYKGIVRGAKLHSWALAGSQSNVSATLKINNILNDFGASITGGYNLNEKALYTAGRIDYARFYTPISFEAGLNQREISTPTNYSDSGATGKNSLVFNESKLNLSVALPLRWYHGIYSTSLTLVGGVSQIGTSRYEFNDSDYTTTPSPDVNFTAVEGRLIFANMRGRAKQNFNPRFGQELTAYVGSSLTSTTALKYSVQGNLYFPRPCTQSQPVFQGRMAQRGYFQPIPFPGRL